MGRVKSNINSSHFTGKVFSILLFSFFCFKISLAQNDSVKIWIDRVERNPQDLIALDGITFYLSYSDPKKCLEYSDKMLKLAEKNKNTGAIINAYVSKSIALRELARYSESLDLNLKAIKVAEQNKDSVNIGHTYTLLANFYHVTYKYQLAEKYYQEANKIFELINDKENQLIILSNLSDVYVNTGRPELAEAALEKSVKGKKESGDRGSIGISYYSLGSFLISQHKINKAAIILDSAIVYLTSVGDKYYYYQTLALKAEVLHQLGKFNESNEILLKLVNNTIIKDNIDLVEGAYRNMSRNFEKLNKPVEALKYARLEKKLSDSIFTKESLNALNEAQAKFDTDKKEKEIELLNKEKKINETELSRQKTIRNSFIVGSIIVIAFALFILRSLQINRRDKKLISEQKETLEHKNKEVTDSIRYAKRIQTALLPNDKYVERTLKRLNEKSDKPKL